MHILRWSGRRQGPLVLAVRQLSDRCRYQRLDVRAKYVSYDDKHHSGRDDLLTNVGPHVIWRYRRERRLGSARIQRVGVVAK